MINLFTARYLDRGLELAQQSDSALVVTMLNTPGGLESSMREMVQAILQSSTPVAIYVTPAGGPGDFGRIVPINRRGLCCYGTSYERRCSDSGCPGW